MDPTLPLLMELGDACGLQPTYTDYWGHKRTLAEPALRHFLSAMGCDGGDEAALRAALAQRGGQHPREVAQAQRLGAHAEDRRERHQLGAVAAVEQGFELIAASGISSSSLRSE